ncbi:unnamed protein product [Macrosiphum euphorbiae]
MPRTK